MQRKKPLTRSPMKRSGRIAPKKRKPSEFARIYGSRARVAWVKSLPCALYPCEGPSENAHVESGGMGRKADACWIVPLCFSHHREVHGSGVQSFARKYGLDLDYCARRIDAAWQLTQDAA